MCVSMVAMYASSNAQSRRQHFRRSHTMVDYISEEDNENETDDVDEESKLIHKIDSPLLPRDNNMIDVHPSAEKKSPVRNMDLLQKRSHSLKNQTKSSNQKRASFQRQRFNTISSSDSAASTSSPNLCTDFSDIKGNNQQRNVITTSQIISKMKDRIRQRMYNYSEWPGAAALVQEMYRQRAKDAIKESLNSRIERSNVECIPLQEFGSVHDHIVRPRTDRTRHSLPTSNIRFLETEQNSAKYLKRRSVSEGQAEHNRRMGRGVVCSNEDLRSIFRDYKKRKSTHLIYRRTHSVDLSKHMRETMESQFSGDSTSSTQSSMTQRTESDADESECVFDANVSLYPEVVVHPISESLCHQTSTSSDNPDGNGNTVFERGDNTDSVLDVIYDEQQEPMWETETVFDAEILGTAIETHLDSLIQSRSVESDASDSKPDDDKSTAEDTSEKTPSLNDADPKPGSKDNVSFWAKLLCIFGGQDGSN